MTRRVVLFSGSRAELGLQIPIWRALERDARLEPLMLIGGAHTQEPRQHPDDLREASIPVAGRVFELPNEGAAGTPGAIATGIIGASEAFDDLRPDLVVVYGDRFESFAALIAATQMRIPVAHVEGGDYTAGGCLDDSVRHAMTKLAHLHFTTNEQAAARVRAMGEEPWRVHCVGLPSLDLAAAGDYASEADLHAKFGLDLSRPVVLFCMHPVPGGDPAEQVANALAAAVGRAFYGAQLIVLQPNNDAGSQRLRETIADVHRKAPKHGCAFQLRENLGRRVFHGLLAHMGSRLGAGCLVGNSSAGIKEAPFFRCPVVNVGPRQQGRLRAANIWDVAGDDLETIRRAVCEAMNAAVSREHVYGNGTAGPRIAEVLATVELGARLLNKRGDALGTSEGLAEAPQV